MYNSLNDFSESRPADRPERKTRCRSCPAHIGLLSPVEDLCWSCYAGHPKNTRPVLNLSKHPNYIRTSEREMAKLSAKMERKAATEVLEEVQV